MAFSTFAPSLLTIGTGGSGSGLNLVNPINFGAFADGSSHTITAPDIAAHTGGGAKLWVGTIVRTVTDGVTTSGSNVVTSATANFTSSDLGQRIEGTGLPGNSRITAVTNSTTVHVGANGINLPTATGTGITLKIGDYVAGDQWDYVALQEAIFAAFQNGSTTPNKASRWLNKQLYIPAGRYQVNKPPTMFEVEGGVVFGDGRLTTQIVATRSGFPAWECNGLWFTQFTGIQWFTGTGLNFSPGIKGGTTVINDDLFIVDGNWDNKHTLGIQGNTWKDCHWDASFSRDPIFSMCRYATNSQGSENLWLDCHFNNPFRTAYSNVTFNALQNTFIGGDFSQHIEGVVVNSGSINMYSVGFQSRKPQQIDFHGYDLHQNNGANAHISMAQCRSESLKLVSGFNGTVIELTNIGFDSAAPDGVWAANHAYTQGKITQGITGGQGNGHLHICWQAGTSGGTEPVWNDSAGSAGTFGVTREILDAAISSGSNAVHSPGGGFAGEGSSINGMAVMIVGAGAAGANLYGTCTFVGGSDITLDVNASTTVSNARLIVGPKTTDGTCIWMHDEFDELSVNGPTILTDCSFRWGSIEANGGGTNSTTKDANWPVKISHCNFARADALNPPGSIAAPVSGVFQFPVVTTQDGKQFTDSYLTLNGGYNDGVLAQRIAPPSRAVAATPTTGTINLSTMSRAVYTLTPTGDCTINSTSGAANASAGGEAVTFIITTSGTTSRNITFGTNFVSTGVLATGTVTAKRFTVSFKLFSDQITWVEICRNGPM